MPNAKKAPETSKVGVETQLTGLRKMVDDAGDQSIKYADLRNDAITLIAQLESGEEGLDAKFDKLVQREFDLGTFLGKDNQ